MLMENSFFSAFRSELQKCIIKNDISQFIYWVLYEAPQGVHKLFDEIPPQFTSAISSCLTEDWFIASSNSPKLVSFIRTRLCNESIYTFISTWFLSLQNNASPLFINNFCSFLSGCIERNDFFMQFSIKVVQSSLIPYILTINPSKYVCNFIQTLLEINGIQATIPESTSHLMLENLIELTKDIDRNIVSFLYFLAAHEDPWIIKNQKKLKSKLTTFFSHPLMEDSSHFFILFIVKYSYINLVFG
jgi:hypothetical protein